MANRYGRDIGRGDRDRPEREGRSDFGRSSSYGSRPFDDDEEYFGGGRQQFGGGYSGGSASDYGSSDYGRSAGYSGRESSGGSGGSRESEYGRGRGGYSQGSQSRYGGGSEREDYGSSGSSGRSSGYGGGGFTGYGGGSRYGERYGGQGGEDFRGSGSRYSSGYPSSERGYGRDYDQGDERGWWDKTSDEVASWFGDEEAASRRQKDARMSGGHRGRGPSGYSRSDDRIKEDLNDRLTDYDYIDATNINVEVGGGEVTLTGTVDNRYEKRMAEDIAEDISGVKNVENRIRVNTGGSSALSTGSQGMGSTSETAGGTGMMGSSTTTQAKGKSSSGS